MDIKIGTLCFYNVVWIKERCSNESWIGNANGLKDYCTRDMICPTGPVFFEVGDDMDTEGYSTYTFYLPISAPLEIKENNTSGFIEEFKINKALSIRQMDLEDESFRYKATIKLVGEENNLKLSDKFYHVYLENYGVEALDIYCQVDEE